MDNSIDFYWVYIPFNIKQLDLCNYIRFLSAEERETYKKFKDRTRKMEFLIGRLMLRKIIASEINVLPEKIQFQKEHFGKLVINQDELGCRPQRIHFNLSHSNGLVACVISKTDEVGVDVEEIQMGYPEILEKVFTKKEINIINLKTKECIRNEMFYLLWTRKEAVLKATGNGFTLDPLSFSVPEPDWGKKSQDNNFQYINFPLLNKRFAAAIAVKSSSLDVYYNIINLPLTELLIQSKG